MTSKKPKTKINLDQYASLAHLISLKASGTITKNLYREIDEIQNRQKRQEKLKNFLGE